MVKALLRIPHWRAFQHYKDRTAPWIKAHRELLLDDEWHELSDLSKAHLFGLWLLAPQYDGKIPFKPEWLARQIGANSAINWKELAESKWIALNESASEVLASLYQDSSLRALAREEESREEESREERVRERTTTKAEVSETYSPSDTLVAKAFAELHMARAAVLAEVPRFISHHRAKGNTFKRVDVAFWNWISRRFVTGGAERFAPAAAPRAPKPMSPEVEALIEATKGQR